MGDVMEDLKVKRIIAGGGFLQESVKIDLSDGSTLTIDDGMSAKQIVDILCMDMSPEAMESNE
jgi:hypothetical protein